jgi:hypothetical protein
MTDKQNDPLTMRLAARWTFARMTNCQNESAFHAKIKLALTGCGLGVLRGLPEKTPKILAPPKMMANRPAVCFKCYKTFFIHHR